ncbi:MAG: hypothetical protein Q7U73_02535 [Rubrivivax sp.]|nr:hypothetical protein [Rubrivivax sp.]
MTCPSRRGTHGARVARALHAALTVGAVAIGVALPHAAAHAAETPEADRGFSYFMGVARQQVRYTETGSFLPFRSEARGASPMLVSGALYALNDRLLMSLDNETTFYPDRSSEVWNATAASFNGTVLTSPVLQRNGFSLQQSKTQVLGLYRLRGPWFGVGGAALRTQSFKRFAFTPGPDNAVATPGDTTVEESVAELVLNVGVGLESEQVRGQANHYSLRALVGVPVWRRLTNTTAPLSTFDAKRGVDFGVEGRYSWALSDKIHAGGWASWSQVRRSAQTLGSNLEMPRSRLSGLGYGVELLWKL